jgi:chromosome segregation ATPase
MRTYPAESERYRNQLRMRDQEVKDHQEQAALTGMETQKLIREAAAYEARVQSLEDELAAAHEAFAALNDQKQENLMLKETIDRLRYEMDELRTNAASAQRPGSGASSRQASLSRSLGEEMRRGLFGLNDDQDPDDSIAEVETIVNEEDEDTEGETEIQTIITRKRKASTPIVRCHPSLTLLAEGCRARKYRPDPQV